MDRDQQRQLQCCCTVEQTKNDPQTSSLALQQHTDSENTPTQLEESQQQAERERQRKVRFSEEENDVLINSIMPHYDKLFGKLAARTSTAVKNALWREIASAVNAISAYPRSLQNCKKRYADVKRKVKDKLCKIAKHRRATGGRTPLNISFWPYERVMEKIISADIVAGVPGATDSGRMADHNTAGPSDIDVASDYTSEIQDENEPTRTEEKELQICTHKLPVDQEEHSMLHMEAVNLDNEVETLIVQEETSKESRQKGSRVLPTQEPREIYSTRQQSMRDHTTLIYAEQSHFRRTMAKKLDILNNNVKALNKNVKAFQLAFNQSIITLSQSVQQQNSIFEKLSSNLLMLAQQQQQYNHLCMSGMQQIFQILPSSKDSASLSVESEKPSETCVKVSGESKQLADVQAQKEPCRHEGDFTGPRRPSSPFEELSKRRRH